MALIYYGRATLVGSECVRLSAAQREAERVVLLQNHSSAMQIGGCKSASFGCESTIWFDRRRRQACNINYMYTRPTKSAAASQVEALSAGRANFRVWPKSEQCNDATGAQQVGLSPVAFVVCLGRIRILNASDGWPNELTKEKKKKSIKRRNTTADASRAEHSIVGLVSISCALVAVVLQLTTTTRPICAV